MTDKKRQVDLSPVDPEDRPYMKRIIQRVVTWQQPPCAMDIRIHPNSDHYNVAFIGWDQAIDDIDFYNTFLKTEGLNRRENVFDMIINTETVPVADAEEHDLITGPIKLFRVKRSGFHTEKKRKK